LLATEQDDEPAICDAGATQNAGVGVRALRKKRAAISGAL
jgi:hypothetical protein